MVEKHLHNGTDSPRLDAKRSILRAPQTALTAASGGSLSSGGAAVLSSADTAILNNLILRVGELSTKLTNLGLIR